MKAKDKLEEGFELVAELEKTAKRDLKLIRDINGACVPTILELETSVDMLKSLCEAAFIRVWDLEVENAELRIMNKLKK